MNFLNKIKYSITKIEKYPEMVVEGTKKTLKYIAILIAILSIVFCIGIIYQTNEIIQKVGNYIETEMPEFSYKEGKLEVEGEQPITIEKEELGVKKVIIDTKQESEEEINKYKEEIKEVGDGIIILKDKVILKNTPLGTETSYSYNEMVNELEINEFVKADVINYIRNGGIISVYAAMFVMLFIYAFINSFVEVICVAAILSIIGYLVSILLKIKMRYKAVFNMSIYAMTLSIIMNVIYVIINIFTNFTITYFQVMYSGVAFIYLIAAIFLMKVDFGKQQEELTKVKETQEEIKEQIQEEKKEQEKQNKEESKKENKDKKNEEEEEINKTDDGQEPEGSNV